MDRSLHRALIASAALGLLWTAPAYALRRGERDVGTPPTANQIVDMADARIATLKADLRLTPGEEKNWGAFQTTVHDIAVQRADAYKNLLSGRTVARGEAGASPAAGTPRTKSPDGKSAKDGSGHDPSSDATSGDVQTRNGVPSEIQSLRDQAEALGRRADELKKIADAAQPLYISLDDTQRSRLMNFIRSNGAEDQATHQRHGHERRR